MLATIHTVLGTIDAVLGAVDGVLAFTFNRQIVFNGLVTGITYGVMAVGLVLIFRISRVINIAHAEVGAFGGALLGLLVAKYGVPYPIALIAGLAAGAAFGGIIELTVVRRLANAPKVILFVATMGAAQVVFLAGFWLPNYTAIASFPTPFDGRWELFDIRIRSAQLLVLIVVPVLVAVLALFLERTKCGTAIRASAENPDAARLSAISTKAMSTAVWTIAGLLSAITAVLVAPLKGQGTVIEAATLGPGLLLRALAAALIARMHSLPMALLAGAVIGGVEAMLLFNYFEEPGLIDAGLFAAMLISVLSYYRRQRGGEGAQSMSFAPRVRPVPRQLQQLWWVRYLPQITVTVALAVAIALPLIVTRPSRHFLYSLMLLLAIVGMSLTLLTGWAGQLSLGQFAFAGLGAMLTTAMVRGVNFSIGDSEFELPVIPFEGAVFLAAFACLVTAVVVGLPALRVRGLFLAVITLAFAVMAQNWLLERDVLTGGDLVVRLPRARWGDTFDLKSQRTYYYVCLGALCLCAILVSRIRRSGVGRSLIAVRDNEQSAAAFTVSPTRMKLVAFAISGALAGLAGGLIAGLRVQFGPTAFSPEESLRVVAIAVIGGLSSIWGVILGALWVVGIPSFFAESEQVRLLTSGAGVLILLMYLPGGLIQVAYSLRDAIFAAAAKRIPDTAVEREPAPIPARAVSAAVADRKTPAGVPALSTIGVSVQFGGVHAVESVDINVQPGEVVGLIGTNGAGKTTLMNAVGGFVPSVGQVEIFGANVTRFSPSRRAGLGLGRTFQQADLFPDLSVRETIQVALEARGRSQVIPTLLGLPSARRRERTRQAEGDELISFFGLGRYASSFISELSTGTRRIVELSCLIALEARVLCLDEPTAGVAQRETEAFAPLVLRIREELGASLLVIEHDMPFIMGISDRVYCLEAGAIIAEGTPDEVRNDPLVIASYLGTDERAIARSGAAAQRANIDSGKDELHD